MMKCKNIKIKLNKQVVCKITNKPIDFKKCNSTCEYFKNNIQNKKIKAKTNKVTKLERNRFSIFGDDKRKCRICGSTYKLTWHEIYDGKNRQNSMICGLCLRLCLNCHKEYQEDKKFNDYWHIKGQIKFMEYYHKTKDDFLNIFKRNYL